LTPRTQTLPKGFWRAPNGSLRVLVRIKGWPTAVKTFKLLGDTPQERRRQFSEAELWAAATRRRMYAGVYTTTREAEEMTLRDALQRYAREGLTSKPANRRKDELRIEAILRDDICDRSVASLTLPDLAAYRDLLIERSCARKIARAIEALQGEPGARRRIEALKSLARLRAELREAPPGEAAEIARRMAEIERAEGIKPVARTTISNRLQLIRRALKFVRQTVPGVPDISGVAMPRANPGRTRRPSERELAAIIAHGGEFQKFLPLIVRFAVATALRIERILECRTSFVHAIGGGKRALSFARSAARAKKTGIIPLTTEIVQVMEEAVALQGGPASIEAAIRADIQLFPISANVLSHAWRKTLAALDIADLRLHDLRHEATSRLFEKGLTAAEVMSITGHSTNDMVDRYAHYSTALVFERLESATVDPDAGSNELLDEIASLVRQYRAADGDEAALHDAFGLKPPKN
jgi:integrase